MQTFIKRLMFDSKRSLAKTPESDKLLIGFFFVKHVLRIGKYRLINHPYLVSVTQRPQKSQYRDIVVSSQEGSGVTRQNTKWLDLPPKSWML